MSLASVVREAIDQVVPDEDVERARRIETMLAAAGGAASGSGTVARDHDDVLASDRW